MKIGILECGPVPAALQEKYSGYPAIFSAQLQPLLPGAVFSTIAVFEGAALPDPAAQDAWLITGSRHGVYDPLPWIEPLKRFIRAAAQQQRRMAGICFGHQIIAEALGGRVEKAATGFRVGLEKYQSTLGGSAQSIAMPAFHQDQVVVQPPDSEVLATAEACAFAALRYTKAPILSVQFHPEFRRGFFGELIETMARQHIPPGLPADAGETDERGMRWIAEFLAGR